MLASLRNSIVITSSQSEQVSLSAFDKLVDALKQQIIKLQTSDEEIKRLQGICEKNKIDYKLQPVESKPKK